MALATSFLAESLARCFRSHVSRSVTSGLLRSLHARPLRRRLAIGVALDREQRIDAFDCLDCDRRLVEPCQIEELAPRMCPAHRLDDRARLAVCVVEAIEARIGIRLHQA